MCGIALGSGCWQLAVGKGRVKAGLKFLVQGSKLGTRTRKAGIPAEWFEGIELFWHPYGMGRKWRAGECLDQVARKPEATGTSVNIGPGNLKSALRSGRAVVV